MLYRFYPLLVTMKRLARTGKFGAALHRVHVCLSLGRSPAAESCLAAGWGREKQGPVTPAVLHSRIM